jgi:hypothetical protein
MRQRRSNTPPGFRRDGIVGITGLLLGAGCVVAYFITGPKALLVVGLVLIVAGQIVIGWRRFKWRRVNPYGSEQDESHS